MVTNLGIRDLDVAPTAVDHVTLSQDPHLSFVRREPDESEAL